jgi:serine/threonine-protein kinase HipA
MKKVNSAVVSLWGNEVGVVTWDDNSEYARFQYQPGFVKSGLNLSPLKMSLKENVVYSFPELNKKTFYGLPGLLADSLPDKYGNSLIDIWLAKQGRDRNDFSPVERLCYMGSRGMGALEFKPNTGPKPKTDVEIDISDMVKLAGDILNQRQSLRVSFHGSEEKALQTIIRIGTSAGGARAKAVIALNPQTKDVRSGQVAVPAGYEHWIIKFDGVDEGSLGETKNYGRIEYIYNTMAENAGIEVSKYDLIEENGRAHFLTKRFDRSDSNEKIHMQSLCAISHFDFNAPGETSYEMVFGVIMTMNLGYDSIKEVYRRMVFNVVSCIRDDHTKNISFLMDKTGKWRIAPAYDIMWSYKSDSPWVSKHQMSVNGKRDHINEDDMISVAKQYDIKGYKEIIAGVKESVSQWPSLAKNMEIPQGDIKRIQRTHNL